MLTTYMVLEVVSMEKSFDMKSLREMVNVELTYIARFDQQLVTGDVLQ